MVDMLLYMAIPMYLLFGLGSWRAFAISLIIQTILGLLFVVASCFFWRDHGEVTGETQGWEL